MNIGIIVYSQTGHTMEAAQRLQAKLESAGHTAAVERLVPAGDGKSSPIRFERLPELSGYDALVLGSPVHGFTLSKPMAAYLTQLPSLGGKKVGLIVTKSLASAWTGGNRAIRLMRAGVEAKGGLTAGTGIVSWVEETREVKLAEAAENITKSLA